MSPRCETRSAFVITCERSLVRCSRRRALRVRDERPKRRPVKASRQRRGILVRLPVCGAVRYYERWVNGAELRVAQLAAGVAPRTVPERAAENSAHSGALLKLELPRHDDHRLSLARLDADALAPIKHVLLHGSMATDDAC